jgi:hypothetical protein
MATLLQLENEMRKQEMELRRLKRWIILNVMGWVEWTEEEYPYRSGFSEGDEFGDKCLEDDMPDYPTDPGAALEVLKRCAEAMPNAIIGIGSPMGKADVISTLPKSKQGWVVGAIGFKPSNFDVEAETLELAICRFAKRLFTAMPLATKSAPKVSEICDHVYSRAMHQPTPRRCVKCGQPETRA